MSELAVPSANDSSKNCTQPRSHSTGLKIGLVLIGLALVVGGALNWHWLVAAGLLPIIVGLLPCAAMCALHLCSGKQRQQPEPRNEGSPARVLIRRSQESVGT